MQQERCYKVDLCIFLSVNNFFSSPVMKDDGVLTPTALRKSKIVCNFCLLAWNRVKAVHSMFWGFENFGIPIHNMLTQKFVNEKSYKNL